ncbi:MULTISPECIES: hypothetical protein [Marinobacter]|jgi:hypothetical protein|uniref:Uncharacterized protein n=1 Tax=Marinobacter manganoxydans MnI7-9 TaxID=1094979 RepID=G6YN22_9GAMM|nr:MULTISPECIES: hypothetical protein [Marinobacter]MBI48056.1 hypothetical protein [Marinobacter sp.]PTB82308.1 hypothetical protein C9984_00510 [Marinobacter sp. Z-D5-3]HAS76500.1 hypothetical protein [Marinobacter adhaerens]AKV97910.1 hypothetical protein ACP86_18115 [Marinobacter sp. CP1]EHJ06415.1 hypothetical protein KYE_01116 [Marinobacter manganoxydans MnI7-9]|tara:strand:+ start:3451 stop:3843 length:393 start_codon:yes stop_codon:yes gene_type:complete
MIKSFALAALIAVLLGFLGFQYYITSVPDLAEPITVEETRFIEQDQSLLLTLRGGEGRQFTVGLRGDIANDPEQTALFFISNPDLVPYVYWPGLRSNDEKRVLELLEDMVEKQKQEEAVRQIYEVLKNRN